MKPGSTPEARRIECDLRLRRARKHGPLRVRLQPYLYIPKDKMGIACLVGQNVVAHLDEPIDFWELWRDTVRFWRLWRADRRRTATGEAAVQQAWALLERASQDLKG